jgi:hypothetical protein
MCRVAALEEASANPEIFICFIPDRFGDKKMPLMFAMAK